MTSYTIDILNRKIELSQLSNLKINLEKLVYRIPAIGSNIGIFLGKGLHVFFSKHFHTSSFEINSLIFVRLSNTRSPYLSGNNT